MSHDLEQQSSKLVPSYMPILTLQTVITDKNTELHCSVWPDTKTVGRKYSEGACPMFDRELETVPDFIE